MCTSEVRVQVAVSRARINESGEQEPIDIVGGKDVWRSERGKKGIRIGKSGHIEAKETL